MTSPSYRMVHMRADDLSVLLNIASRARSRGLIGADDQPVLDAYTRADQALRDASSDNRREVVYFGCWGRVGHGYHDQRGHSLGPVSPWGYKIDSLHDHGGHVPQGTRYLAHKDGWTALDVTDRTVDSRPGSHSAFLAPMHLSEQGMVRLVADTFPQIAVRIGLIAPASLTGGSAPIPTEATGSNANTEQRGETP